MHMHRAPQTMQVAPMQGDVVQQVEGFLHIQARLLRTHGVEASRIVLDPGIGFGKTVQQNFTLLAHQAQIQSIGYPILAGWSRKSSLGAVTGLPLDDRLAPSIAAALLSVDRGARIVRVHDVRETRAALAVWRAMQATI
jgi:dihydropteroate synthase